MPVPVLKRVRKGRNQLERLSVIRGKAVKDCKPESCNPLLASLNDLYEGDAGDCPGIEERSTDTITTFGILISKENTFADSTKAQNSGQITLKGTLVAETGYADRNVWVDWRMYTAEKHRVKNCVACGTTRTLLETVPFPVTPKR